MIRHQATAAMIRGTIGPSVVSPAQFAGPPTPAVMSSRIDAARATVPTPTIRGQRTRRGSPWSCGISNSTYTRLETTKPVSTRSVTGSNGIGSSGFRAMLIPNTAAPIASQ